MNNYILYNNRKIYIEHNNGNFSFFYINDNKRKYVDIVTIFRIFSTFFNGNEEIVTNVNGIEVTKNVLDGNYHFYKNNNEDYNKFFIYNLKEDVLYIKDKNSKEKLPLQQKNTIFGKDCKIVIEAALATLFAVYFALGLNTFGRIYKGDIDTNSNDLQYSITEPVIDKYNSFDINKIKDESNFTEDEKELLLNENLFDMLSKTPMTEDWSRELYTRLSNMSIEEYEYKNDNIAGYYSVSDVNKIYTTNRSDSSISAHEFIHLLQSSQNKYYYIIESFAELASHELILDNDIQNINYNYSYNEGVKRLCVLMEIIGPEPVWELNFSGSNTSFENAISKYLSKEETEKFLNTISTTYNKDGIINNKMNEDIDKYLSIMYFNKTNNDIKDDEIISKVYKSYGENKEYISYRRYFKPFDNKVNGEDCFDFKCFNSIGLEDAYKQNMINIFNTNFHTREIISYEQFLEEEKRVEDLDDPAITYELFPEVKFDGNKDINYKFTGEKSEDCVTIYSSDSIKIRSYSYGELVNMIKNQKQSEYFYLTGNFIKTVYYNYDYYIPSKEIFEKYNVMDDHANYEYSVIAEQNNDFNKYTTIIYKDKENKISIPAFYNYDDITLDLNNMEKSNSFFGK